MLRVRCEGTGPGEPEADEHRRHQGPHRLRRQPGACSLAWSECPRCLPAHMRGCVRGVRVLYMHIFTMRNGMGLATDVAQAQQFAIVMYT